MLEPSSRFPSGSQKILALFTYLLRFVLSKLELSYIAERVCKWEASCYKRGLLIGYVDRTVS
jgi:hypothetical protein